MTLAKAAPPDWAAWFANITGLPIEYVRHKLGMEVPTDRLGNENGPNRERCERLNRGLTTTTVRSR